jgi:MYXO-CTERM domain-containing protein
VPRFALALALLLGGLVSAQPATYFAPVAARTPASSPVGANAMQTSIGLPDPGVGADLSYLFGTGGGASVPFLLGTQQAATVTGFPPQVDAVATAPGVRVGNASKTLLAVSSGGGVIFGTINSGTFQQLQATTSITSRARIALSATRTGAAVLLSTDGFQITRYDLDVSSGQVVVTPGLSINAAAVGATDEANTIWFDATSNLGYVGGRVLGDIYTFDARMDAGQPTVFDAALVSNGRLAPPVTGLTAYVGQGVLYLLAANSQGLTVYDLLSANPRGGAFRVIPQDDAGAQITAPAGVAVTNLPAGAAFPEGVIAVGDRTQTDLALVRWDILAGQVDGGLVIDTTFDPRGDGGFPDGGLPDGGGGLDGGGGGAGPPPNTPIGPGIPVDHGSSCSTAAGGPALLAALAGLLLLLPRRRQRR